MTPQPDFIYPLFCFTTDGDIWSICTPDELEHCGPKAWRDKVQIGMDIVDAECRCWRVLDVTPGPPDQFSWRSLIPFQTRRIPVRHEFEPLGDLSLEEVRERLFAVFDANPIMFCLSTDTDEEIEEMKREIRAMKTLAPMHDETGACAFVY